jgi:hypothetical protein
LLLYSENMISLQLWQLHRWILLSLWKWHMVMCPTRLWLYGTMPPTRKWSTVWTKFSDWERSIRMLWHHFAAMDLPLW